MKRRILTVIAIIVLCASFSAILYPFISDLIFKGNTQTLINKFNTKEDTVVDIKDQDNKQLSFNDAVKQKKADNEGYLINEQGKRTSNTPVVFKADIERLYSDSVRYNKVLIANQRSNLLETDNYRGSALNLSNYGILDGVYGYISADKIDMRLPIVLGASKYNMSIGAAHLNNTSLPIGGKNTNCVLAGHTGYIGRTFFDNLPKLTIGDKITITNYFETLTYEIVKVTVKKPKESDLIFIEDGKDLLTLLTCTPGDNGTFDRYCLICERK